MKETPLTLTETEKSHLLTAILMTIGRRKEAIRAEYEIHDEDTEMHVHYINQSIAVLEDVAKKLKPS